MPPATISASETIASCGDRWQPALGHEEPSLVMITSVATCITPRIPAQ